MIKKLLMIGILGSLLVFGASPLNAITIGFDPASQVVGLGTPVEVALTISDLGDGTAPSLGGFDLDIAFDPTILGFTGATFGDPVLGDQLDLFGLGSITDVVDSGLGSVNLFELSFDDPFDLEDFQAGSFTLATLTFDTLSTGTSALNFTNIILSDAWGDLLIADEVQSGSVSAVPEPATIVLLVTGMAGIGVLGRKKYRNSKSSTG